MDNRHKSIVKEAEIYYNDEFLKKDEADKLFTLLNDDEKFKYYNLYFYDGKKKEIVSTKNHRRSYWFGDHAQAVQTSNKIVVDQETGEEIHVPTDYVLPCQFPSEIRALKEKIEKEYNVKFNSCLVGKFESSKDKIGFHSDASTSMGEDPQIGSVSFGKSRNFKLKRKSGKGEPSKESITVTLDHGDVVVMRNGGNKNYLHAVPPDKDCSVKDCRINLTFRYYIYSDDEKQFVAQ